MNQNIDTKIESKINEDLSPTKNLSGIHLKIVASIAIIWSLFHFGMHLHFLFGSYWNV